LEILKINNCVIENCTSYKIIRVNYQLINYNYILLKNNYKPVEGIYNQNKAQALKFLAGAVIIETRTV